jgi:hypothetical protein
MLPSLIATDPAPVSAPREQLSRECVQALGLLLLVKCLLLVLDPSLRFFMGDSGSYLHAALTDWLPPDRSITYPWLVSISAVAAQNAFALVALQTLFGASTALIVFALLRAGAGLSYRWALLTAVLVILEPSQLFYERMLMAESAGQLAFLLSIATLFLHVHSGRLRWLPLFVLAGLAAVSLRLSLLPVVLGLTLLAPLLRAGFHAAREDAGRPIVALLRAFGHGALLLAMLFFAHSAYRAFYAEQLGGEPAYLRAEGQMRLGLVAPLVKPEHLQRVKLDPALLDRLSHRLADPRAREAQIWMPGGLWQTLEEAAAAKGRDPYKLAGKISVRALQSDPLALLRMGASTLADYFDTDLTRARMLSDLGVEPLPEGMRGDLLKRLRYDASQVHQELGPVARYFQASGPWLTLVMVAAAPMALVLLVFSRHPCRSRALVWTLAFASLGFVAGQFLTAHIVSFRYLQPLPPLVLAMSALLLWRWRQRAVAAAATAPVAAVGSTLLQRASMGGARASVGRAGP